MARLRRGKGLNGNAAPTAADRLPFRGADFVTISIYAPPDRTAKRPDFSGIAAEIPTEAEIPAVIEAPTEAEAAVRRLAAEYPEHAHRDIANMERYLDSMTSDHHGRAAHYNEILRIAHDVRGQGSVFGYPLITRCAGSLCRATRLLDAHDHAILNIVRAHLAAMRAMLEGNVTGIKNRTALAVAAGLEMLVSTRADR